MGSPIRLKPHTIEPATTDGATLVTVGGVAAWEDASDSPIREVLMASGVSPPEPLESSDGGDWLYGSR